MIKTVAHHAAKLGHAEHPLLVVYAAVESASAHNLLIMVITALLVVTGIAAIIIKDA